MIEIIGVHDVEIDPLDNGVRVGLRTSEPMGRVLEALIDSFDEYQVGVTALAAGHDVIWIDVPDADAAVGAVRWFVGSGHVTSPWDTFRDQARLIEERERATASEIGALLANRPR